MRYHRIGRKPLSESHRASISRSRRANARPQVIPPEQREKIRATLLVRYADSWRQTRPRLYAKLLEAQGGKCAICGGPPRDGEKLCMDHDHTHCGRSGCAECIRGLLCHECNRALGRYEALRAGIDTYLVARA